MRVTLRIDGPRREWHRRLGARLGGAGHSLRVESGPARRPLPSGLPLLLVAEQKLLKATSRLFAPIASPRHDRSEVGELVLEVRFDGEAGDAALVDALLARRAPHVEVRDVTGEVTRRLAAGLPAVERPEVVAAALDMVLARTIELVERAVRAAGRVSPALTPAETADRRPAVSPAAFFARTLAAKLARRLDVSHGMREGWRIALLRDAGQAIASRNLDGCPLALLPNDGTGFQADPFLFAHDGRTCLFYEELPFATKKGVIAMVELDATGAPSPPRRVLERDVHLSYPFVFAHEGTVFMLPEMSATRRLQLFRADPFPDRWVPDRILIDDAPLHDATLVVHDGRLWLFATRSDDGDSSWDALHLFHAPAPFGPWTPHAENPVIIDAGAARPAGAMWHEGDTLMRVAQDCRAGYGGGLTICRIDRLDLEGFTQTVVGRIAVPAGSGAVRIHTLNRACGYDVIDLDFPPRRRRDQATR